MLARAGLLGFLILAFAASLGSSVLAEDGLVIKDGWVRFAPPTAKVHAAYFTVQNNSKETQKLVGVESPVYGRTELHKSMVVDGVAKMEAMDGIAIEPGDIVTMKPGGLHTMLFEPKDPQVLGGTVPMVLKFESGARIAVDAKIAKGDGMGMSDHMHHHEEK